MKYYSAKKGFTLFYALLIASLALSIGAAIYDLTERELELSAATTQSQYAVYAADTGAECALYWDNHYSGNASAFATSSSYTGAPNNSTLDCVGMDITNPGAAPVAADWTVQSDANDATTTFTLNFTNTPPSEPYCATVQVVKVGNPPVTTITSNGFNTCQSSGLQLERTLQVSY